MLQVKVNPSMANLSYPKIMVSNSGTLVYFVMDKKGVSLVDLAYPTEFRDDWHMPSFKDFHGSITITQE